MTALSPRRPSRPAPAPGSRPVLLSIKPHWVSLIASGAKTVELRRSRCGAHPGGAAVIYTSWPVKRVTHVATIAAVHALDPGVLAARHGDAACVSAQELLAYAGDLPVAYGIELTDVRAVDPLTLPGRGPQSWRYLWDDTPADRNILAALGLLPQDPA